MGAAPLARSLLLAPSLLSLFYIIFSFLTLLRRMDVIDVHRKKFFFFFFFCKNWVQ